MRHLKALRNALFFCVPALISLQGCEMPQNDETFQPLQAESYEADVLLAYGEDQTAGLHLTRIGDSVWDAAFTEPASLAGVVLSFDGSAVSASYKGLAFTIPKSALPAKNMLGMVTEALDAADAAESLPCTQQEDGSWCYQGSCAGGNYTLTFGQSGEPLVFDLPSQPLKLTFSEFRVIQSTAESSDAQTNVSTSETTQTACTTDTSLTSSTVTSTT